MVRKDEVGTWKEKLTEGKTYFMHNFWVMSNEGEYKVQDHPFKLLFMSGNTIIDSDVLNISLNVHNVKDFCDIITKNYCHDILVGKNFNVYV